MTQTDQLYEDQRIQELYSPAFDRQLLVQKFGDDAHAAVEHADQCVKMFNEAYSICEYQKSLVVIPHAQAQKMQGIRLFETVHPPEEKA